FLPDLPAIPSPFSRNLASQLSTLNSRLWKSTPPASPPFSSVCASTPSVSPVNSKVCAPLRSVRRIHPLCFHTLTNSRFTQFLPSPVFSSDCAFPGGEGGHFVFKGKCAARPSLLSPTSLPSEAPGA